MAENLSLLTQTQDREVPIREPAGRPEPSPARPETPASHTPSGNPPEISEYHSLEDTLSYQHHSQPETPQPPRAQPPPSPMHQRPQISNAPITGQVCR